MNYSNNFIVDLTVDSSSDDDDEQVVPGDYIEKKAFTYLNSLESDPLRW